MGKYLIRLSMKISVVIFILWLICFITTNSEEPPDVIQNKNYWLNGDTSKVLQIKKLNYETKMIEYRDNTPPSEDIVNRKVRYRSIETDLMNSDMDFYEVYEYYAD